MKLRDYIFVLVGLVLSIFVKWTLDDFLLNTIFTVLGIMFSIGLGLIVTFNLQGVKNKKLVNILRSKLKTVRGIYIRYFGIATFLFILDKYLREKKISIIHVAELRGFSVEVNFAFLICFLLIIIIIYYILNFIKTQELNEEIFDELNKT